MLEIRLELLLRIRSLRKQTRGIQLVERERRGRSESLDRTGEVEIEPEERVIDQVPVLWPLRSVAPEIVGAGADGIVEHVDRGSELLPDDLLPG